MFVGLQMRVGETQPGSHIQDPSAVRAEWELWTDNLAKTGIRWSEWPALPLIEWATKSQRSFASNQCLQIVEQALDRKRALRMEVYAERSPRIALVA